MKNNPESLYIMRCRERVEVILNWGNSAEWTNQDFEQLAENIREATDVDLSATTLKRIWGRVKYESAPTLTTLNALASYLGYEHWRAFKQANPVGGVNDITAAGVSGEVGNVHKAMQDQQEAIKVPSPISASSGLDRPTKSLRYLWPAIAAGVIIVIVIFGFRYMHQSTSGVTPVYEFSSRKTVTDGLPNSVIFDYNAADAPGDSVFIQQNWDPSRRMKVSRDRKHATSVYYYPGHYEAKLVVNGKIVKEHSLRINTKGWLPVIERTPVPVYFKEEEAQRGDVFGLSTGQIQEKNVLLQPEVPWVQYSNIGNWDSLTTDHFYFEASLRNDFAEGSAACQQSQIILICEGGAITVPMANKGCIAELNMMVGGEFISGKSNDLSALGADMSAWNHVSCESKDGRIRILVNERPVYEGKKPGKTMRIAGVRVRFQGTGSIRDVKLTANRA